MALSKPALMSAFLCPGIGQWAAGRRALGAALIVAAVISAGAPFARFFWALFQPHDCGDLLTAAGGIFARAMRCTGVGIADSISATARVAEIGFPCFAGVWLGSVLHASRLTIGGTTGGGPAPRGASKP